MDTQVHNNIITRSLNRVIFRAVQLGYRHIQVNPVIGTALRELPNFSEVKRPVMHNADNYVESIVHEEKNGYEIGAIRGVSVHVRSNIRWDDLRIMSGDFLMADLGKEFDISAFNLI